MVTRAEHRHRTLRSLSDAAVACFEEAGPGATVDRIAERAGMSRRTVFRYVGAKEELAFIHPVLWFDVFEGALEACAADATLSERLHEASRAIARHIDEEPEPVRRAFTVAAVHPELAPGFMAVFQRWVDRVAAVVLAARPDPSPQDRFHSRIVGSAVMGMVDAVLREWVADDEVAFVDLYDDGFRLLAPILALAE